MVKSAISFFDPIGHAPNQLPTTSPMGLKNELADITMTMTGVPKTTKKVDHKFPEILCLSTQMMHYL